MSHLDNRFYIIDADDENIESIIAVTKGPLEDQRPSVAGPPKLVIKLCKGDNKSYAFLEGYPEYTDSNDLAAALDNDNFRMILP